MKQKLSLFLAAIPFAAVLIACGGTSGLIPNCVDWSMTLSQNPVQVIRGSNRTFNMTSEFAGNISLTQPTFPAGITVVKTGNQQFRMDATATASLGASSGTVKLSPEFQTMCQEKEFTVPFNVSAQAAQ